MANSLPNPLNPPIIVQEVEGFNVVRDDLLPGGTKQRGLFNFLKRKIKMGFTTFAYAGPAQGVAQVALGVGAEILGIEAHMFFSGRRGEISLFAGEIGVIMHPIMGPLTECQETAIKWQLESPKERFLLPFGLDDDFFKECLVGAVKQAMPPVDIKHMWLVGGSGVLVRCFYHVFPETYFHLIQVGRHIHPDTLDLTRTHVIVHPEKFNVPASVMPPYKTVDNYDAKVWFYVKKYGQPGDFIWNVAG